MPVSDSVAKQDSKQARRSASARRRANRNELIATMGMTGAALFLVIVLLAIVVLLLSRGLPAISWQFLTSASSFASEGGGIGPQIFFSLYMLIVSLLLTAPLGIGAAIYLSEYARPGRLTSALLFSTEALASVPSVVFGVFGAIVFVSFFKLRFSLISGALTLTLLNLPLMVRITEDAIRAVPIAYREASLALGATRWETIRKAVLPSAVPGIVTALVLTSGRLIGETAPLILTTGTTISPNARYSLDLFQTGETLAVHIWVLKIVGVPGLQDAQKVADGSAAVLLLIVLAVNLAAAYYTERLRRQLSGAVAAPRAGGAKKEAR
jgi:phosphate transport system permease protein